MERLLEKAREIAPRLVEIRREIHRHPEPGFREFRTAGLVERELNRIGLANVQRVAGTGVVADIGSGPAILLRADMDALEISEETGVAYQSEVPGMMHACGHDAHTAMLLGAAELIAANAPALRHRVRFVFQPCEETSPGGALALIRENILDDVGAAVALHVYPQEPVGTIALKRGAMMANADDFDLVFRGRSGHAAAPHHAKDALVAAAEFVCRIQKIVARCTDPFDSVVITVGKITAGTRRNIIAGEARLDGTARTLSLAMRGKVREAIERTARCVADEMEIEHELHYLEGYPVVWNSDGMTDRVARVAAGILGEGKVTAMAHPSMGGEDFAYMAQKVPGCFFRLGSGGPDPETRHSHHNSRFNIDESCLPIGAAILAGVALDWVPGESDAPLQPTGTK